MSKINFLITLGSAIRNGAVKTIQQAVAFAKREFGKVDDDFLNDIINVFKKEGKVKKKGDVVPIKKDEGIMATDEAADVVKKRTDDIAKGDVTGETSDLMKGLEDKAKEIKKAADDLKKVADEPAFSMIGAARDPRRGVVRAAAREILNKNKVKIGSEDPINVLRQMYGEDGLEAIDAISDSLLDAQSYSEMNTILRDNKLFDLVPKKTYGYDQNVVSAEKIRKAKEQEAKQRKILEDFDPDREPNAYGGIAGQLHFNRTGFNGGGTSLQKLRQAIVESMRPYAPGVSEDQLQLIVKDITLDMSAEEAQASAKANFTKLFGMAEGGRVGMAEGGLIDILKL